MKILVTGSAGFIGMHTVMHLLARGDQVVGIDNLNDYYDPQLKLDRLSHISESWPHGDFQFKKIDISDSHLINELFSSEKFDYVVHLAAQAGVRYSLENPGAYAQSNLVGFVNILEACRHNKIKHLVYASSSSVYGGNTNMPFSEDHSVDHPVSLYAATKKANELMAHCYSHLYGLPTTGLRFFTVYGPWGRPDMAPMLFARAIQAGEPIKVFNDGKMKRDFTYIDDIVAGVVAALDQVPSDNPSFERNNPTAASSWAPYRVFNIGHSEPVELMDFIAALEASIGKSAIKNFQPMQPGDVIATYADTSKLEQWTGLHPTTSIEQGVQKFVSWYVNYTRTKAE